MVVGVDPGLSGGIAVLDENGGLVAVERMPTTKLKNGKRMVDGVGLSFFLAKYLPGIKAAVIEDVHSMPGQGVVSTFTFGFSTGIVHGVLSAHLIPIFRISSAGWKAHYGLSRDKRESIAKVHKLYGDKVSMRIKNHDGMAEAILIGKIGVGF